MRVIYRDGIYWSDKKDADIGSRYIDWLLSASSTLVLGFQLRGLCLHYRTILKQWRTQEYRGVELKIFRKLKNIINDDKLY